MFVEKVNLALSENIDFGNKKVVPLELCNSKLEWVQSGGRS